MSVDVLPVEMRVEVAIIPSSPLGNLHDFVTGTDESFELPVPAGKPNAFTEADPSGRSMGLVLDGNKASSKPHELWSVHMSHG